MKVEKNAARQGETVGLGQRVLMPSLILAAIGLAIVLLVFVL